MNLKPVSATQNLSKKKIYKIPTFLGSGTQKLASQKIRCWETGWSPVHPFILSPDCSFFKLRKAKNDLDAGINTTLFPVQRTSSPTSVMKFRCMHCQRTKEVAAPPWVTPGTKVNFKIFPQASGLLAWIWRVTETSCVLLLSTIDGPSYHCHRREKEEPFYFLVPYPSPGANGLHPLLQNILEGTRLCCTT